MCTSYGKFLFPPPAKSSSSSFFGRVMCHIFSSNTQLNSYLIYHSDVKLEKKKSEIELTAWHVAFALVDCSAAILAAFQTMPEVQISKLKLSTSNLKAFQVQDAKQLSLVQI